MNEAELLKKLREAFSAEAEERLASLSSSLLRLEKGADDAARAQHLEVAFREAHSLKGAARSVNLPEIETLSQAIEGVFAAMKREEIQPAAGLFDLLHGCVRFIEDFLATSETDRPDRMKEITSLVSQLKEAHSGRTTSMLEHMPVDSARLETARDVPSKETKGSPKTEGTTESARVKTGPAAEPLPPEQGLGRGPRKVSASDSIRVSTAKLDSLVLKAEELVSLKLTSNQHLADLKAIVHFIETWGKKWHEMESHRRVIRRMFQTNRVLDHLDQFLDWSHDFVSSLGAELRSMAKESEQKGRMLGSMVDDLLNDMKRVTMLPLATLLDIFPRMVREISRDQGKDVDLIVKGSEVEIDRRILEEMRDPLTHILRNAVDHGLESPEEREKRGKPRKGVIELTISQNEAGKVEVLISDDGRGIDLEQVKKKAMGLGIVTGPELATLEDRDALSLVFRSGVSTSPIVTDLSGRGLGLAIVQEKVEKLGGCLSLNTALGRGTSFRMELPVTIATFHGIQVAVGGRSFLIPSSGVERTLRVQRDEIQTVENRASVPLNGKTLSLMDLAAVFGLEKTQGPSNGSDVVTVAVLGTGDRRIGFRVDEVLGEQEVLVKGLGKQLRHVPYISGATILGSGKVVPLLNVNELLDAPMSTPVQSAAMDQTKGEATRRSILVAEDSITSRMLLKSILEGAGYEVQTAVDGAEAFATLKSGEFDLVVSDVEMPRLDGFELTRKIRSDNKYADVPIILVTGLGTQEDREKGIDAGANAYIVKSNFDQGNLLDVIRRMI